MVSDESVGPAVAERETPAGLKGEGIGGPAADATSSTSLRRPGTIPAQALILRRWALQLLGTEPGPSLPLREAAAAVSPEAWDLFLRVERCALALQRLLDATGGWDDLPKSARKMIRGHAAGDLMRALSAKAQLRVFGRLAVERGWGVMVLKGGVSVASGEFLHLGDLDLLVEEAKLGEVESAFVELGYEAQGDATSYHLAPRAVEHAIEIEVHRSIDDGSGFESFRDAALPIEGEPGILRMGGADHLRLLLRHSSGNHPERAGRIRELLLLGHALRTASPGEIAEVEAGLAGEPNGERMRAILDLARAFEAREFESDPFGAMVFRAYILFHHFLWLGKGRFGILVLASATRFVGSGRGGWREVYTRLLESPMRTFSRYTALDRLDRIARPVADLGRRLVGLLTFGAVSAITLSVDVVARATRPRRLPG